MIIPSVVNKALLVVKHKKRKETFSPSNIIHNQYLSRIRQHISIRCCPLSNPLRDIDIRVVSNKGPFLNIIEIIGGIRFVCVLGRRLRRERRRRRN